MGSYLEYQCSNCYGGYDSIEEAVECCNCEYEEAFKCNNCSSEYYSEEDADECCLFECEECGQEYGDEYEAEECCKGYEDNE